MSIKKELLSKFKDSNFTHLDFEDLKNLNQKLFSIETKLLPPSLTIKKLISLILSYLDLDD